MHTIGFHLYKESENQNTGSNKQETVIDTENKWLPEGKGIKEMSEMGEGS